jgi:acetyl esterase
MISLDPRVQAYLEKHKGKPGFDWRSSVDEARRMFWKQAHALEADAPVMLETRNLTVGGADGPLDARLYVPHAVGVADGPGIVFFHGGGFTVGDLDSHEMLCRRLADAARVRVLSVAYRLAPEHRFPAAPEDAYAAVQWTARHGAALGIVGDRIMVAGDSAGGCLSAVVAQETKKRAGAPLVAQMLIYPCTQFLQLTPSQIRLKEGYFLTQAAQDFFRDKYLRTREDALDTRCSPIMENDLAGLPPCYLVTAGFDPLYDEGVAYRDKLEACGVPVTWRNYPAQVHGFFNMTALSTGARDAIAEAGRWAGEILARQA